MSAVKRIKMWRGKLFEYVLFYNNNIPSRVFFDPWYQNDLKVPQENISQPYFVVFTYIIRRC